MTGLYVALWRVQAGCLVAVVWQGCMLVGFAMLNVGPSHT